MLTPWLDQPGAHACLETWSGRTGLDLVSLGTVAPGEVVRRTDLAQPLLTAVALLSGRALLAGGHPELVCGHSIGELSALALAGVISDDEAVVLAAGRGSAMAEAAALAPTGMAAVLGGDPLDPELVRAAGLEIATVNAPGQVVLGGPVQALDAFVPPAGARLRRLAVAGAFHTVAMAPAQERLATLVARLTPADPVCGVIANADGAVLHDGQQLLDRLVAQLTGPVRFDLCLRSASAATRAVELAPGGTLKALVRRVLPDLPVTALNQPDDLLVTA